MWVVDSEWTNHVAWDRNEFMEYRRVSVGSRRWIMENDSSVEVIGIGAFKLNFGSGSSLILHDIIRIPRIWRNLLFVSKLLSLGLSVDFCQNNVIITFGIDQWWIGFCRDDWFCAYLNFSSSNASKRYFFSAKYVDFVNESIIWHTRLRHKGWENDPAGSRRTSWSPLFSHLIHLREVCCRRINEKTFWQSQICIRPLNLLHSDIYGHISAKAQNGCPTTSHLLTIFCDTVMFIWSSTSLNHLDIFNITWRRLRAVRVWKHSRVVVGANIYLISSRNYVSRGDHPTANYSLHTAAK